MPSPDTYQARPSLGAAVGLAHIFKAITLAVAAAVQDIIKPLFSTPLPPLRVRQGLPSMLLLAVTEVPLNF